MLFTRKTKLKKIGSIVIANAARYVFLIAFSYVLIYPVLYLFVRSLMSYTDTLDPTVLWIPKNATFSNIINAAALLSFFKALGYTFLNMLIAGGIEVFTCLIFAYGLSRYKFKGKTLLTFIMLLTILIPNTMIIIPNYLNMRNFDIVGIFGLIYKISGVDLRLNLIDTSWSMWLPSIFGVGLRGGLFIFIYSQFFKGLPKELEEAASIDGAGLYKTLFGIVVPSSSVAIITVLMLSMIWHWNEYYLPQMYFVQDFPLSVELKMIENSAISYKAIAQPYSYNLSVAAGCMITIIPVLIFYLLMQKKFIASIANSGIVG